MKNSHSILNIFDNLTKRWFESSLGQPTTIQEEAWPAIAKGGHVLVSAPTGTGKTLSAFLVFIDKFKKQQREGILKNELQLIYISPLKALAADIRENLYKPLNGILNEEMDAGYERQSLSIAIRTGDTSQKDRRAMIKNPPHILITTPESLFLMLTSKSSKEMLSTASAIIIDELHAMIDSKRGAHMMLSLARLDKLCGKPLQRIGLSATIEPLDVAAQYLSGNTDITITAPKMEKKIKIEVVSPAPNMFNLAEGSVWQDIAQAVYDQCHDTRSVIAFTDGRQFAEKLAYQVNIIARTKDGIENFARTHHGCVSKEQRFEAENDLRSGKLRLLCATSSMELGIDVGEIDRVVQIGCPSKISSVMQRLGRAGHNPGRTSVMKMFPRTVAESIHCGLTAHTANNFIIEKSAPPRLCFDVLAQHLVSMATDEGYYIDEVMEILPLAYPFKDVTKEDVKAILNMLAGDYEHRKDLPVRPRLLYDRINERVEGDTYSRMLAVSTGGTIPDLGMFSVKAQNGKKLGELDEEMVFEQRVGYKFLLGSFAWKIVQITKDTVFVEPASITGARPPFWRLAWMSRKLQIGVEFGKLLKGLSEAAAGIASEYNEDNIIKYLNGLGLDEFAAANAVGFLTRQLEATGILPDNETIIIEHFADEAGDNQIMFHSIFGRQVNQPLSILLQKHLEKATPLEVDAYEDDDGILLAAKNAFQFPKGLLLEIKPETARPVLEAALISSTLFNLAFRHNAARALMMGVSRGKRNPLWIQRLRAAEFLDMIVDYPDHPLIRETKRECLEDFWDLDGLEWVLTGIQTGAIQVRELYKEAPSPMSLHLRREAEANQVYNYFPSTKGINAAAQDMLNEAQKIKPAAEQLAQVSERRKLPEDEKQLHSLLMIEGDIVAGELSIPYEWLESLAQQGRAMYIEPGLWIAAENAEKYAKVFDATPETQDQDELKNIVRRTLRYKGAHYPEQVAERYFLAEETTLKILIALANDKEAIEDDGLYYHADLYERARNATITARRKQVKTVPPQNYAALLTKKLKLHAPPLTKKLKLHAPPEEQLKKALNDLRDRLHPIALWESILFPARVNNYRTEILNKVLSNGEMFYSIAQINNQAQLSFHSYEDIDWDADMLEISGGLEGDEKIIYDFLLKRGASFHSSFSTVIDSRPSHDTLMSLLENGLIHCDSFAPVKQWLNQAKTQKATARQRVNARMITLTSGRWEVTRPVKALSNEEILNRIFDKTVVLCRENYKYAAENFTGITWGAMLETLRVWEYTGQARRGYFVDGLSGMQFIREQDFSSTVHSLENPGFDDSIVWLSAIDPLQAWGKYIPHLEGKGFTNTTVTAVALGSGVPIAVFEKSGKALRLLDENISQECIASLLESFAKAFKGKNIFYDLKRITVKEYPPEVTGQFKDAGFQKALLDYMLFGI